MSNETSRIVKKLTAKSVMHNVKKVVKDAGLKDGDEMQLFRIIGKVSSCEGVDSEYGTSIRFKGVFEAINDVTGEVVSSHSQCFLPEVAQDLLHSVVMAHQDGDSEANVAFGFEIGVRADDNLPTGYEYTCRPLVEAKGEDALSDLRNETLLLDAPKKTTGKRSAKKKAA